MSIEKRREREKEEMKELILSAASEIVALEGFEQISIRKIAAKIEYSPSIIYHYFADKDEIINHLMRKGYKKIVEAVSAADRKSDSPEEQIKEMTRNYIEAALRMPEEFMAAHLNKSSQALEHTSYLFKGASTENPALVVLYQCIKEINKDIEIDNLKLELIAQMIAAASFGFIIKLIIEKDLGEDQRQTLIKYFSEEVVLRMAKYNKD